mmetsp:Transcript_48301/g.126297  ORF Transcript_48301/g.126297 Transcript_48301/m.126297 type:complete len:393 (+) Transcript_48301:17-1195(+)
MDAVLRVAVVGAGSIGREFALRHFGPHTRTAVTSIVDIDPAAAERLAIDVGSVAAGAWVMGGGYSETVSERLGTPVAFDTALTDNILAACDAVYVGTTPNSHRELALRSLASDKHLLLEKPLAVSAADADAIAEAATAAAARGIHASMNIGMRYNRALIEMRRLLDTQELGELRSAKLGLHFAQWPREWQQVAWCAGRNEGGPLREVGTHFLFAVHELFGHGSVKRVRATVEYAAGSSTGAETVVAGAMELEGGLEVAVSVSTDGSVSGSSGDLYELSVTGDKGTLVLDEFTALRRLGWRKRTLVKPGPYGRAECVHAFVEAAELARSSCNADATKLSAGDGVRSSREEDGAPKELQRQMWRPVSVIEGRNAQRVLDAMLSSDGAWVDVGYS